MNLKNFLPEPHKILYIALFFDIRLPDIKIIYIK